MTSRSINRTIIIMIPFVLPLGLALDLYLPSIAWMTHALHAQPTQIQLTMTIFLYCFGLGQLIMGPLTDRFGRHKILLISLLLFALGGLVCSLATHISTLIWGRALQAFGACGSQVVSLAMVRDQFEGSAATRIFTTLKGAMALAPIAAPIVGAFVQIHYGWQTNFILLTGYGMLIFLVAAFLLTETRRGNSADSWLQQYFYPYKSILAQSQFWYFALCGIVTQAAMFGYFSLSPRYFMILHHLSETQFAWLFSINAFTFLITSVFAGFLVIKIGFFKSTLLAAGLLIVSGCAMGMSEFYFTHPYVLFVPNLIASSSAALMLGASTSGALMPFKNNAGTAAALFGCCEFIGGAFVGSQAISDRTITAFPLATALILMGFFIIILYVYFQAKMRHLTA